MKYKYLAYTLLLALTSTLTQAQVKIGNNPTTITPGALLDIEGSTATTRTVSLPNGNFGIGVSAPVSTLDVGGRIGFGGTLANGQIYGGANALYMTTGTGGFYMYNDAQNKINMTVTNAGNVGIGVNTPVSTLDVGGRIGFGGTLDNGQIYGGASSLYMKTGMGGFYMYNDTESKINMTVTNAGKVGIGVNTPGSTLDVGGEIGFGGSVANGQIFGGSSALYMAPGSNGFYMYDYAKGRVNMTVTDAGRVGIGTASPTSTLHVTGGSYPLRVEGLPLTTGLQNTLAVDNNGTVFRVQYNSNLPLVVATLAGTGANLLGNDVWVYTGTYITLPANSRYVVQANMLLNPNITLPNGVYAWVQSALSDSQSSFSYTPDANIGLNKLFSGLSQYTYSSLTGSVIITNSSSSPKTYYYWGKVQTTGSNFPNIYFVKNFGGNLSSENQMIAIPVN